jgi:4-amino-4-deoxy-L-arabinose transferase-like glycosyltransferase
VVAFAAAFVMRASVFRLSSSDHDEAVYVLQARALAEGRLTLPLYHDLAFFQPWFTWPLHGHLAFVFPPGWPAVLAVSQVLSGSMLPALAAVSALTVLGMYLFTREVTRSHVTASVAAVFTTLAPVLVIQSGLYLSYLFTLAVGLFFGWSVLRGSRTGATGAFVGAGLLLGVIFLTRPYDAFLWGLPVGAYLLATGWQQLNATVVRIGWLALGLVAPVATMLAFNAHVTGNPTRFPITAIDPLNTFGFGARRLVPTGVTFEFDSDFALRASWHNLEHAPPWVFGGVAGLVLAAAGVWVARRAPTTYLMLGLGAGFAIGYLDYWGIMLMAGGAPFLGPQYYFPMLVPVVVLGATALVAAWRVHRVLAVGITVVLVGVTVPSMIDKISTNADALQFYSSADAALHSRPLPHSVVFVPYWRDKYLLTDYPFAMNPPDLDAGTLYAVDRGPENIELVTHTDRTPYLLSVDLRPTEHGFAARTTLHAVHVETAPAFRVTAHVVNRSDFPVVTAYVDTGVDHQQVVLDTSSTRGATYDVTWTVSSPARAGGSVLALQPGHRWLATGVSFGPAIDVGREDDVWEQRLAYSTTASGAGDVDILEPALGWHRIAGADGNLGFIRQPAGSTLTASAAAVTAP